MSVAFQRSVSARPAARSDHRRRMPLEVGNSRPLMLRTEHVHLGLSEPIKFLYASDLHLGWRWTNHIAGELVDVARSTAPDVILLGGDLADRAAGICPLSDCVRSLVAIAPVLAIPGNHDRRPGVDVVKAVVESAGGKWLSGPAALFRHRDIHFGADPAASPPPGEASIFCGHDPAIFPTAAASGYRLVLAGHLHGGQCVLATLRGRQYPGAWFARWTGNRFSMNGAEMIVSNGAADTLPLRWNCPREVILCEIR